jgi:hypothetical protein
MFSLDVLDEHEINNSKHKHLNIFLNLPDFITVKYSNFAGVAIETPSTSVANRVQYEYDFHIYPPYGIKYGSNFQPFVNKRDVKDRKDEDLPEKIEAIRE